MGKAHPSSHALSYMPNTVSLLDYPVANDHQTRPQILSLTHRRCRSKPNL